jgi:hypothetical protein
VLLPSLELLVDQVLRLNMHRCDVSLSADSLYSFDASLNGFVLAVVKSLREETTSASREACREMLAALLRSAQRSEDELVDSASILPALLQVEGCILANSCAWSYDRQQPIEDHWFRDFLFFCTQVKQSKARRLLARIWLA